MTGATRARESSSGESATRLSSATAASPAGPPVAGEALPQRTTGPGPGPAPGSSATIRQDEALTPYINRTRGSGTVGKPQVTASRQPSTRG